MASDQSIPNYADHKWWKEAIVYQIYPASFLSTGSGSEPGWGDIKGITRKIPYLKDLGVDILWLSPIYKSPQADMGYDISDYNDIDPRYGTLADVDELIARLKASGMRLMMDLVVNHTSDQHAWFEDSRSSKTSAKRDWYIWQPPKYGKDGERQPLNNWSQIFSAASSAWTWDERTGEYYLSLFTPEQPDLNWRNPDVREAVYDVLRFWLDRGVSGFRMDVINHISKVEGYPDAVVTIPDAKYQPGSAHYHNGPHLHEYLKDIRANVLDDYDTITVGEMPGVDDDDEVLRIVGADRNELNMIFIFDMVAIAMEGSRFTSRDWAPPDLRNIVTRWQKLMRKRNGWNSVFIENHDVPRSVSVFVDDSDAYRDLGAKLLCMLVTTLGGTLYIYQGQELGLRNFPLDWDVEEYKDVESINYWKNMQPKYPKDEKALQQARHLMQQKARDNARTPMPWTPGPNAGFCDPGTKPWMRVNSDYKEYNVQTELADTSGRSVVQFWRHALQRRKNFKDVFVYGSYECVDETDDSVIAYSRTSVQGETWVSVLNFSEKELEWDVPNHLKVDAFAESNYGVGPIHPNDGKVKLRPWEGLVGRTVRK